MIVDFLGDIAEIMANKLFRAGYNNFVIPYAFARACITKTILTYLRINHRTIQPKPRKIFNGRYKVCPQHLEAVNEILRKAEEGESLRQHMSTRLSNAIFDDDMLNDFGIHHFHLSLKPHYKNNAFLERTKHLLFAMISDESFYAIGIYDHHSWSKIDILEQVNKDNPTILNPHKVRQFVELNYDVTDKDRSDARQAHINVFSRLSDGSIIGQPGGGISSNGVSEKVSLTMNELRRASRDLERQHIGKKANIVEINGNIYLRTLSGTMHILPIKIPDII